MTLRFFFGAFFLLLLTGCASRPVVQPTFLLRHAHSSGSRVAVDSSGRLLASGGLAGELSLWDGKSGQRLKRWEGHQGSVYGLAFLDHDRLLASGGWDGRLVLWSRQGRKVRSLAIGAPVTALVVEADGRHFWSGQKDGHLARWNLVLEPQEQMVLPNGGRVAALAWCDGRLAVADTSGNLWLRRRDSALRHLAHLPAYLRTLAFDCKKRRLFGGSWFRLYRWQLPDGGMSILSTQHHGIITGLHWDSTRKSLFSISRQTDSSVLELDPGNGATRTDFGRHDLCGADVKVSRNGRLLVTTSDDGSVRVWRLPPP